MVWRFLKGLGIKLPMTQQSHYWGIHTEETIMQNHTYTLMFIAALVTIVRTWK